MRPTDDKLGVPWWIYVGTRGSAKGIHLFLMKTSENPDIPEFVTMTPLGLVADTAEPSFLVVEPKRRILYCVNESAAAVSAFAIERSSGKLDLLGKQPSLGARPCHLALDREGRHLLVANAGGSVAVLPLGPDGKLGPAGDIRPYAGQGGRAGAGPRPQGVALSPDDRFAFVCDGGLDRLAIHRFDARAGKLSAAPALLATKPGAGPRRLVFHPDGQRAYLVSELDSTVTAFAYDAAAGTLKDRQTLSTLPGYFDGPNRAAELAVHPGGKYLYVSNCGHNSVVLFAIDEQGTLRYVEDQSTYGTLPVHFGLDGPGLHLAVANQGSGSVLILRAPESGRVKPGAKPAPLPGAACAVFVRPS